MRISNIGKKLLIFPIRLYSLIVSPWLGQNCRFHQSCSSYSIESIEKHGVIKGLYLCITRILNCHPYSKRSFSDKVPVRFAWRDLIGYKRITQNKVNNRKNYEQPSKPNE